MTYAEKKYLTVRVKLARNEIYFCTPSLFDAILFSIAVTCQILSLDQYPGIRFRELKVDDESFGISRLKLALTRECSDSSVVSL